MKKNNMDDLQEIVVPESHDYFLKLILNRHLINFYLEVKALSQEDPKFMETLSHLLQNREKHNQDLQGSFNELIEKEIKSLQERVNRKA